MSLITETKKLRGLEQQFSGLVQDANYLYYPDGDEAVRCRGDLGGSMASGTGLAELLCELHNLAPIMLAALCMVQEGDAEKLEAARSWLKTTNANQVIIEAMDRAVHMAALMEKEVQP